MQVLGWGRMAWSISAVAWLGCVPVTGEAPPTGDIPQSAWPAAWFRPPATASAVGLQTFRQSPVLDELVAAGELPPVAERLPDDPVVVEPYGEIGRYGGTARLFFAGESLINVPEGVLRPGPQMRLNLPNFAAKAEYRNGRADLADYSAPRPQVVRRPSRDGWRLCVLVRPRADERGTDAGGGASVQGGADRKARRA